jgi:REP element-mobilizing transposase RayT
MLRDDAAYHGATATEGVGSRKYFLISLEKLKKFHFKLRNFTVTDNRIHFLIKPGRDVSLSKIMR